MNLPGLERLQHNWHCLSAELIIVWYEYGGASSGIPRVGLERWLVTLQHNREGPTGHREDPTETKLQVSCGGPGLGFFQLCMLR